MGSASFTPRPDLTGLLIGGLADALEPAVDEQPAPAPPRFELPRRPFEYLIGMTPCEVAGINGDAANGCPYAGEDFCTCDPED